jgi:hypothetical protein
MLSSGGEVRKRIPWEPRILPLVWAIICHYCFSLSNGRCFEDTEGYRSDLAAAREEASGQGH